LETSHWCSGSSAGISRCSCRCSICVLIVRWSISDNQSANPRCCKCIFFIQLLNWTNADT
jgi:hypothetical protein